MKYISKTGRRSFITEIDSDITVGSITANNATLGDVTSKDLVSKSITLVHDSDLEYAAGVIVEREGKLYKSNSAIPAGTIFQEGRDTQEWSAISGSGGIEQFDSTKEYFTNDIVIFNKALFQAKVDIPEGRGYGDNPFAHAGMDSDWELIHRDSLSKECHVSEFADSDYSNGTVEFPFKSIKSALDNFSWDSDSSLVIHPGTYNEPNLVSGSETYMALDFGSTGFYPPISIPGGRGSVILGGPGTDFVLFTSLSPIVKPDTLVYSDLVFASKGDFRIAGNNLTFIEGCEFQKGFTAASVSGIKVRNTYAVGNDSDSLITLNYGDVQNSELGPVLAANGFEIKDSTIYDLRSVFLNDSRITNTIIKTNNAIDTHSQGMWVDTTNKTLILKDVRFASSQCFISSNVKYHLENVTIPTAPGYKVLNGTAVVQPLTEKTYTSKEFHLIEMDSEINYTTEHLVTVDSDGAFKKVSYADLLVSKNTDVDFDGADVVLYDSENNISRTSVSSLYTDIKNQTKYEDYVHVNNAAYLTTDSEKEDGSFLFPYTSLKRAIAAGVRGEWNGKTGMLIHPGVYDETSATDPSLSFDQSGVGYMYEVRAAIPGTVTIGPEGDVGINDQYISMHTPLYHSVAVPYNVPGFGSAMPFFGIRFTVRVSCATNDPDAKIYFKDCEVFGEQSNILVSNPALGGAYFEDTLIDTNDETVDIQGGGTNPATFVRSRVRGTDLTMSGLVSATDTVFEETVTIDSASSTVYPTFTRCRFENNFNVASGKKVRVIDCNFASTVNNNGEIEGSGINTTLSITGTGSRTNLFDSGTKRIRFNDQIVIDNIDSDAYPTAGHILLIDSDTNTVRKAKSSDILIGSKGNCIFVNSEYTGSKTDGSFQFPYKTIQSAMDAGVANEWPEDCHDIILFPGIHEISDYNYYLPISTVMRNYSGGLNIGRTFGFSALIEGTATIKSRDSSDSDDAGQFTWNDSSVILNAITPDNGEMRFNGIIFDIRPRLFAREEERTPVFENCTFRHSVQANNVLHAHGRVVNCQFLNSGPGSCAPTNSIVVDGCVFHASTTLGQNLHITNSTFKAKVGLGNNTKLTNCVIDGSYDENITTYAETGSGIFAYTTYGAQGSILDNCTVNGKIYLSNIVGTNPSNLTLNNTSYHGLVQEAGSSLIKPEDSILSLGKAEMRWVDSDFSESSSNHVLVLDSENVVRKKKIVGGSSDVFPVANFITLEQPSNWAPASISVGDLLENMTVSESTGDLTFSNNAVTINTAGDYEIEYTLLPSGMPSNSFCRWALYKNGVQLSAYTLHTGSDSSYNYGEVPSTSYIGSFEAGDTLDIRLHSGACTNVYSGYTSFTVNQVAGHIAAVGFESNYFYGDFNLALNNTTTIAAGQDITYNSETVHGLDTASGAINLKGGVTYELSVDFGINSANNGVEVLDINMVWADSANNNLGFGTIAAISDNYSNGVNRSLSRNPSSSVIYKPQSDITVKLRTSYVGGGSSAPTAYGTVVIKAIAGGLPISSDNYVGRSSGASSDDNNEAVTSPDGAFQVRTISNGQLQAISLVGGSWSANRSYITTTSGGDGANITLQSGSTNMNSWTTLASGSWPSHGGLTVVHLFNDTTRKMYRITKMITSGYSYDPIAIEVLV